MTPEAWTAIGVIATAVSAMVVAFIRSCRVLRAENTAQHAQSYGLLQSIDNRTMMMDEKLDAHGDRIIALERDVKDLKDR